MQKQVGFTYNVLDSCAVQSVAHPSPAKPPGDASCLSQADMGRPREPVARSTTAGEIVLPRASLVLGPFFGLSPSVSIGRGVRSIDPSYISQDRATPFAQIGSYEVGLAYKGAPGDLDLELRVSGFRTHVDQDLVFSETEGRNVLANGTTRIGGALSGRLRGPWFDQNASVTMVRSTFDDTGLLIPYVPDVVVRSDSVVFGALPWQLGGQAPIATVGLGITKVPTDQSKCDDGKDGTILCGTGSSVLAEVDGPFAMDLHKGGTLADADGVAMDAAPFGALTGLNKQDNVAFDPTTKYAFGFEVVKATYNHSTFGHLNADGLSFVDRQYPSPP